MGGKMDINGTDKMAKFSLPADRPRDPRLWSLDLKLAYACYRAETLIDRYPVLAEIWLRESDTLRAAIARDQAGDISVDI